MKKLTAINSLSGGFQIIIGALITLITVPVFIHRMGAELYGVFSLIVVVNNLSVFTNFGFNLSLIKYLAEQGKTIESNYDIITTFVILSGVLIPFSAIGICYNRFILEKLLHIGATHVNSDTLWLFNFYILSVVLLVLAQVPSAILDSQQKVYLTNAVQVFYNLISRLAVLISISISMSLAWVGAAYFLSTFVWFIVLLVSAYRSWRSLGGGDYFANSIRVAKKHLCTVLGYI